MFVFSFFCKFVILEFSELEFFNFLHLLEHTTTIISAPFFPSKCTFSQFYTSFHGKSNFYYSWHCSSPVSVILTKQWSPGFLFKHLSMVTFRFCPPMLDRLTLVIATWLNSFPNAGLDLLEALLITITHMEWLYAIFRNNCPRLETFTNTWLIKSSSSIGRITEAILSKISNLAFTFKLKQKTI